MKAAVTLRPGGPIELRDLDDPVPGSGEVLVRVEAASVNRLDRAVFDGAGIGRAVDFPIVQGIDAAGTVAVGGAAFQPGMRVVVKPTIPCRRCGWCRAGRRADCVAPRLMGIHRQGGYAEFVAVPRANVFGLPPGIDSRRAAAAAHVHPVVLRMIRAAALQPGETAFVTAGGGAVGGAAVQLGVALGGRVLAGASSPAKAAHVERLGGVAVTERGQALSRRIRDLTDGAGVDVVLDASGEPEVLPPAVDALARGGRVVVIGTQGGSRLEIDLERLYRNRQRIEGTASSSDADFRDAFRLIAEHSIEPVIGVVHPLERIDEAMEAVLDRNRIGKVIVDIGS